MPESVAFLLSHTVDQCFKNHFSKKRENRYAGEGQIQQVGTPVRSCYNNPQQEDEARLWASLVEINHTWKVSG